MKKKTTEKLTNEQAIYNLIEITKLMNKQIELQGKLVDMLFTSVDRLYFLVTLTFFLCIVLEVRLWLG